MRLRASLKTPLLRVYRRLPGRLQAFALRLAAPKVIMGVSAVIRDRRGRVLLAHHTYRRHAWALPSGLIDAREQPRAALARELREELGVEAAIGPLLHAELEPGTRHLTLYYEATVAGTVRPDGVEVDRLHYTAMDELPVLIGAVAPPWLRTGRERRPDAA